MPSMERATPAEVNYPEECSRAKSPWCMSVEVVVMARSQFFRANVGIAVLDDEGRVLVLERYELAGAWQPPQGGLGEGEEPEQAARRELFEETGLNWDQVECLASILDGSLTSSAVTSASPIPGAARSKVVRRTVNR
jgi:hypothetical protein